MSKLITSLILMAVVLAWIVILIVIGVRASYEYEREVGGFWELADRASTIPKKAEYIDKFVAALEAQHLDGEYNAVLFPTPANSFDRNMEALKTLQSRLHEIEKMDVTSFQYQTAIQQITAQEQGEAKQMLDVLSGTWWKRHHFIVWEWMLLLHFAGMIALGVVATIFFVRYMEDY